MTQNVDFEKYKNFVNEVTSKESKDYSHFTARLFELEKEGFHSERLLTAAVGMSAEAGEFTEVVKKIVFQGKPVNNDNLFHLKRELGDIMWYVMQACIGLDVSLEEIVEMNVEKLLSRYPEGAFDVHFSENRKEGDV
jgi:NTP pyrophosphatase (non-canonical NTP hydrolase)